MVLGDALLVQMPSITYRKPERLIFWTACFAVIHRAAAVGFWLLGFAVGMESFTRSGADAQGRFFLTLATYLDFPFIIFDRSGVIYHRAHYIPGREPPELWTSAIWGDGILGPFPSAVQLCWSLCVGLIIAILLVRLKRVKQ